MLFSQTEWEFEGYGKEKTGNQKGLSRQYLSSEQSFIGKRIASWLGVGKYWLRCLC